MANSADFVRLGPEAKVDIQDIPFAVVSGDYAVRRDVPKRTDTESVGIRRKASPLRELEANLELQQSDDGGYHAAPLDLTTGDSVSIKIWPAGRGDAAGPVQADQFVVSSFSGNFQVEGSPVQKVRISGASDGAIFLPGE